MNKIIFLLLFLFGFGFSQTDLFEITPKQGATRKLIKNATIYIVNTETSDSLLLSEYTGTKAGTYYRANTSFGTYKVYVNGSLIKSNQVFGATAEMLADSSVTSAKIATEAVTVTDTTALKSLDESRTGYTVYVQDDGLFMVIDSTYTEGIVAFDNTTQGKQWARYEVVQNNHQYNALWALTNDGTTANSISKFTSLQSIAKNKEVYFPPGVYLFDDSISIQSNINFLGDSAVWKLDDSVNKNLVEISADSNIVFEGIIFDGNGTNQTGERYTVYLSNGVKDIEWNGCTFRNAQHNSIRTESGAFVTNTNLKIINCEFYGWGNGAAVSWYYVNNSIFTGNTGNHTGYSTTSNPGFIAIVAGSNNRISDNSCTLGTSGSDAAFGFEIIDNANGEPKNNIITGNYINGANYTYNGGMTIEGNRNIVSNNIIEYYKYIAGIENVGELNNVYGNIIYNSTTNGIANNTDGRNSINALNIIDSIKSTGYAIAAQRSASPTSDSSSHIIVLGNLVNDSYRGIYGNSGFNESIISSNLLLNTTTRALQFAAGNTDATAIDSLLIIGNAIYGTTGNPFSTGSGTHKRAWNIIGNMFMNPADVAGGDPYTLPVDSIMSISYNMGLNTWRQNVSSLNGFQILNEITTDYPYEIQEDTQAAIGIKADQLVLMYRTDPSTYVYKYISTTNSDTTFTVSGSAP